MSATSSVFFKLFIISFYNLLPICSGSTISHINSNHNNNNNGVTEWQRNLESQISRLVGRLDQLELRVGRVQSLVQMRFDNIENGLTTTKLRMDLWGDELSRMEEQLGRKWKILESKFDIMIGNIDSKLESKLNAMQRDNRRHNEFLASAFNAVATGQEKLSEKVSSSMIEVNSSLEEMKITAKNSTPTESSLPSLSSSTAILVQNSDKMLNILEAFISNTTTSRKPSPPVVAFPDYHNHTIVQYQLLGNKVTNMFEDLMKRSTSMETTMKDAISATNATRRDVHDGFRTLLHITTASQQQQQTRNSNGGNNGRSSSSVGLSSSGSSSEVLSAVIVEALASVESMSSALGRRISDFSRSVDERLEMVSMSINGFLESCVRIQDNAPLIEDDIANLLMKILDTVDNSTRAASDVWYSLAQQIADDRENWTMSRCPTSQDDDNEINPSIQTIKQPHPLSTDNTEPESSSERAEIEVPGNEVVMVVHNTGSPSAGDGGYPGSPGSGGEDSMSINRSEMDSQESVLLRQRVHQRKRPLTTSATETFSERTTGDDILTEQDKKSLWESYFYPTVPE